jgi:Ca-activated chloride channel family protein
MREELDDARLTAYVLGELPEDERAALESHISGSQEARRTLEEIRAAALALRQAFAAEERHALTPEQRARIDAAATPDPLPLVPPRPRVRPWLRAAAALAVAAGIVLAIALPSLRRARVASTRTAATPTAPGSPQPTAAANALSRAQLEQLKSLGYVQGDEALPSTVEAYRFPSAAFNTEAYDHIADNPFVLVASDPRSTFSADVDTASYAIVRRFLNGGQLPPKDAVRIEELVNYFPYAYAPPTDGRPFAVHMDVASCPWSPSHRLVRVALKGRELPRGERPPANLVFLLDVSGSMDEPNKLPLVQAAMRLLVGELQPKDRVAIVVYAGAEGLALPSTLASDRSSILSAIESLSPGGTTHGSAGIRLAYQTAAANFIKGGINRVILATDGDFNVGVTNQGDLIRLIEEKAKSRVFLTALGFGMGNLKDSTLEKLADHGNGNYAYIDSLMEARKVLVEQVGATLVTIAKDVKLQVEFNPRKVKAFRLIGYENRVLAHQDFNDDKKDAGDIGAGHTVTAFYEIVPPGEAVDAPAVDPLKYQSPARSSTGADSGELLTLKLRYKQPDADQSSLVEVPLKDSGKAFQAADPDFRFAVAVAAFGMLLRESPHKGEADYGKVLAWANASRGADEVGLRAEFVRLVDLARSLPRK